jgi:hypothetical protein
MSITKILAIVLAAILLLILSYALGYRFGYSRGIKDVFEAFQYVHKLVEESEDEE